MEFPRWTPLLGLLHCLVLVSQAFELNFVLSADSVLDSKPSLRFDDKAPMQSKSSWNIWSIKPAG
jgi:hypothetical protein